MKSLQRFTGLIGLILMAAFLLPYIFKLPQLDITLILMGGLGLAVLIIFLPTRTNKNFSDRLKTHGIFTKLRK